MKAPSLNYDRNERIKVPSVRLIDDEGENLGVFKTSEALIMAKERNLDLVLLSASPEDPVAKIIDWAKFKYMQSKKHKNAKGRTKSKEWWFKPKIADFDIHVKLNNIHKFLKKGGTAKLTVKAQRRVPRNQMIETMDRVLELAAEFSEQVTEVATEGRNLSSIIKLKSKPKTNEKEQNQDA